MPDPKKLALILGAPGPGPGEDAPPDEGAPPEGGDELSMAMQDFIDAVKSGDAQAAADAFRAGCMVCQSPAEPPPPPPPDVVGGGAE